MQTIYLDISNKGVIPCIQAKQNEVGRKFIAVITDNGVPYNIPSDALLAVWYEGDTDAGNYSSIDKRSAFTIDGNKVSVELVAQMLLKPGDGEMCLSISRGNGTEINTWNIPYSVEYKPGSGSAVPTEYYTALTDAAARAAEQVGNSASHALEAENQAKKSETYAQNAQASAKAAQDAADSAAEIVGMKYLEIASAIIPIGYVFHWERVEGSEIDLTTAENVHNYFGFGTWEQIKDVFLLSAGDNHPYGETGGRETQTLTIDQIPPHTHDLLGISSRVPASVWNGAVGTGSAETNIELGTTGGGEPFDIMPPYRAVYVWKRIA